MAHTAAQAGQNKAILINKNKELENNNTAALLFIKQTGTHRAIIRAKDNNRAKQLNRTEDTMKSNTQTQQLTAANNIGQETSTFALNTGIVMAALVGLWGFACMIGGLMSSGFGGVIQGYISAVTGM